MCVWQCLCWCVKESECQGFWVLYRIVCVCALYGCLMDSLNWVWLGVCLKGSVWVHSPCLQLGLSLVRQRGLCVFVRVCFWMYAMVLEVWSPDYSLVNTSHWCVCVCAFRFAHIYSGVWIYLFRYLVKLGHVSNTVCLSSMISAHIIPIWRYSMAVLGTTRPVTACLTCHCVGWCDAMLNQPICSRLSWHRGELIGGRREEKGHWTCDLARHGIQKISWTTALKTVQSINKSVMECELLSFSVETRLVNASKKSG